MFVVVIFFEFNHEPLFFSASYNSLFAGLYIKAEIGLITKGGYRHFMEKEIFEQPSVIPQTISTFIKNNSEIKIDLNKLGFKK